MVCVYVCFILHCFTCCCQEPYSILPQKNIASIVYPSRNIALIYFFKDKKCSHFLSGFLHVALTPHIMYIQIFHTNYSDLLKGVAGTACKGENEIKNMVKHVVCAYAGNNYCFYSSEGKERCYVQSCIPYHRL